MKSLLVNKNQYFIEDFLIKYVKTTQAEKKYIHYSLNPDEIKSLLMKCPEFLSNIDYAIEFLIRSNDSNLNTNNKSSSFSDSNISFDFLQGKLLKHQSLAKNRITNTESQNESINTVKKIESVMKDDKLSFFAETLIYSYSTLIMISRSSYDTKGPVNAKNLQILNQLVDFYNLYSIQSNFSPINVKSIKRSDDDMNQYNPLFTGIPSGSPNIHRKGIASNGYFLFVLHSDLFLTIFPISSENGGFLSPFMCKLILNQSLETASLSFSFDNLIITTNQSIISIKISNLISGQISSECPEIQNQNQIQNKDSIFVVTDGVVNVTIHQHKELLLATIKSNDSQKEINQVVLHKTQNFDDFYKIYPFDNSILQWPVETNGIVLSFYIKIDQNQTLCRQFSLIDGSHLRDEIIETTLNISSITYDSINQMHYVAVDNNGQLLIHALSSSFDCCVDPFIFGFKVPDFSGKKDLKSKFLTFFSIKPKSQKDDDDFKNEKEFVYLFSSILLSSIFLKKDIETFIIEGSENILLLPFFIIEIAKIIHSNKINNNNIIEKDKDIIMSNIQLSSIQALAILFVINVRHFYLQMNKENSNSHEDHIFKKIEAGIIEFIMELSQIKEPFSMNIIAYIILNLFDIINIVGDDDNCHQFQQIIEGLLISSNTSLSNYIIHVLYINSEKFSFLSFTNVNNVFKKYIENECKLSEVHPNIVSFLLCHQRCVINQVHRSMEKDHFSAYSLIININYNDCKTDNESLNNFGEYTNFLVNQITSSLILSSSFEEFQKTTIYFLFSNYLSLITGLYNYNEIAQIVTPLLHITQNSINEFFERKKVIILKNEEAENILIKIGVAFGAFTGTLIKGGNYSEFDEKYKWLIRPNMNLISHPDLLYELDNLTTDLKTFLDENVQHFLSTENDLNGKIVLQKIYKKWNFNMNKNLKSPLLELDQLFFAVELYHLQLFNELKDDNIDKLRPALQQMMRVRNTARAILRSSDSSRKVPILGDENVIDENDDKKKVRKSDGDELTSYYSPFDLIVIKCKMLLRMKSKFDDSNVSNAPKLLADFVLSPDQPNVLINYISNQQNRLQLTKIGFSLIEATYSLKIDGILIRAIDTILSIVVDNFDGLSAIIQYDSSHNSEKQISNFLLRALKSMESPYLALVVYKLMKSEALSNETIGNSIELVLSNSISNNKLFGLCYKRFGYISNILTDSNTFLFSCSESEKKKVSLISLPVEYFDKITAKEWFIISDVLSIQQCDVSIYQKILHFFLNYNDFHYNQAKLQYVSRCIYSFYAKFNDSYSLKDVKKDFNSLLTCLSKSITKNENLERASEIVTFFRKILILCNQYTLIVNEIFKSYEFSMNDHLSNMHDYDETLCAIFAILGGFVDVIKPNYPISFRTDRTNIQNGIFLDQNAIVKYPVNEETKPIIIKNINVYAEPLIPFNWCMFPNFSFIISFLYYATEDLSSKICLIYLNSLSYYLKEESFYGSLLDDHIMHLIQKLAPYMSPFDTLKDTRSIISCLLFKKKINTFKDSNFSVMSNNILNCTTFLSPVLKLSKTTLVVEFSGNFNGYFGLVADCPLEKQFPYALIHSETGVVYPGLVGSKHGNIGPINSNTIEFSVDAAQQKIYFKKVAIQIPQIEYKTFKFKIFISVFEPCKVVSINTKSSGSDKFRMNYKPQLSIDNFENNESLIKFPAWTNYKTVGQAKSILLDEVSKNFNPLTVTDLSNYPLFEMIDFRYLLFRFDQANSISNDYVNSIIDHVYLKLVTQMSTLVIMYLVNNGYGSFLYNLKSSYLIKLFSFLQIPLEPFDAEKLATVDFPFMFNESILNEDSLVVYNQQFDGIENEMKNCLHVISQIFDGEIFTNSLKSYIEKMGNDPRVHTLRNIDLNVLHYDLLYCGSILTMNFQSKNMKSIVVSTSYFNNFQINTVEKISPKASSIIHFPFIFDTNNNDRASIDININQLKNYKKSVSALMIDGYSNHWVFGTSYELLLLLKEYYMITHDSSFVRKKLVEWVLIDSPFINIFLPKLLLYFSQEDFMSPSDYKKDYLQCLICLSTLINYHNQNIDQNLSTFLFQEKRALNSNFQAKIAHLFPEFYLKPPKITDCSVSKSSTVSINLPELDIQAKMSNPLTTFMLCKSFISKRELMQSYPYWELLPIWLSISLDYCSGNKRKEKQGMEVHKRSDITIIKKSDGFYEIQNPFKKKATICINPSTRLQVKVNLNSCFIIADTSTFDNPIVINSINIFEPIDVSGEILYLSSNNIEGPLDFIIGFEGDKNSPKSTDNSNNNNNNKAKGNLYEFDPSLIHNDFVNEIKMLIYKWTEDETSELLSIIPPFLFQQTLFQPLVEIVLSPDMRYNTIFPPRVVLIVTYIVHRLNYLHFSRRESISAQLWRSVNHLISFDEAAKQFFDSIIRNRTKRVYININRFEAHRMAIEMTGNQSNSVICQMSKILSLNPSMWRSTDMIWHVDFWNEAAIDVGGPSRELYSEISMSIFEPSSGLFIQSPNGRSKYGSRYRDVYVPFHVSFPRSRLNEIDSNQREMCYKAIGVFLGIVMRTGFYQDIPFAPIVWKLIAGEKINPKDVYEIDQRLSDFFSTLRKAAQNKDKTVFNEQFNSRSNKLTWTCENWDGSSIKVDNPTRSSIVKREHVNTYITNCIKKRIEVLYEKVCFIRRGFCENIGFSRHQFMSGKIISFLAQGSNVITTAQLKKVFLFPLDEDLKIGSIGYNNFWCAVDRMNNNQRSLLLKFITAFTRLPNPAALNEFVIKVSPLVGSKPNYLPQASTCFNTLYLPVYTTPEMAFRMITTAIETCQTMEKS